MHCWKKRAGKELINTFIQQPLLVPENWTCLENKKTGHCLLRQSMEKCWCFHFISPAEMNPHRGCDTLISSLFWIFQEPEKHPAQAGLPRSNECLQSSGRLSRLSLQTAACTEPQHLLSPRSRSASSLCPSARRSLGELISNSLQESWEGGRAGVWRRWTGHILKSATHSSVLPSAWNCQVTATTGDNKPKMWNVGVTGKKSRWR